MYVINDYEIVDMCSEYYLLSPTLASKLSSQRLAMILMALKEQDKREITEEKLLGMAQQYGVDIHVLKQVLISTCQILRPLAARKIPSIYLNIDDELVEQLIVDSLKKDYPVHCCQKDFLDFQSPSLVIFFRKNYSSVDFNSVLNTLKDQVYLITCGVLHDQLIIDNIYFNHSGLPTHGSNLSALMSVPLCEEQGMSHRDHLSFYRGLFKQDIKAFPTLSFSACQRGYMAYAIDRFLACYVKFDGQPTPFDAMNWRWHVDLLTFGVQKEVVLLEEEATP